MISGFETLDSREKLGKLKEIADCLCNFYRAGTTDRSLLYGSSGAAIFLMNYWKFSKDDKYYKAASKLIVDSYDYLSHQAHVHIHKPETVHLKFESGLSGIAWALIYLQKQHFIDCQFDEVLTTLDCHIFRLMIDGVHSKDTDEVRSAVEVAFYALGRGTCLSQEYLARFIRESESIIQNTPDRVTKLLYNHFYTIYPDKCRFSGTYDLVPADALLLEYEKNLSALIGSVRIDFPSGKVSEWTLPSNHTFHLHPGIHNGLAGIGLSLLAGIKKYT